MGESHDSGRNLGWDGNGKMATVPNEFRESSCRVSRIEIGADNGRLQNEALPAPTALASRDALYNTPPPLFQRKFPVWHRLWAIQGRVEAWIARRREGKSRVVPERIMGEI